MKSQTLIVSSIGINKKRDLSATLSSLHVIVRGNFGWAAKGAMSF